MPEQENYPASDFLRDYTDWDAAVQQALSRDQLKMANRGLEIAKNGFESRYFDDPAAFEYRHTRFECILNATRGELPAEVAARVAASGESERLPGKLLLALHTWYCSKSDDEIKDAPEPDWTKVLAIFEDLQA